MSTEGSYLRYCDIMTEPSYQVGRTAGFVNVNLQKSLREAMIRQEVFVRATGSGPLNKEEGQGVLKGL